MDRLTARLVQADEWEADAKVVAEEAARALGHAGEGEIEGEGEGESESEGEVKGEDEGEGAGRLTQTLTRR